MCHWRQCLFPNEVAGNCRPRRQGELFPFRHGQMAKLAIERVVHTQFLSVHHCRVTAENIVFYLNNQLAILHQI